MEPTKVCGTCSQRKPWSEFHSYYRNGEARPLSRCKECDRESRKEFAALNPGKIREYRRTYYQRLRQDPERYAARLEADREYKRRRRGTDPNKHRTSRIMRDANLGAPILLDAGPFLSWLESAPEGAVRSVGRVLSSLRHGQALVSIDVVHRACWEAGVSVETIYGDALAT